jgi:signal transduction histidine kinase
MKARILMVDDVESNLVALEAVLAGPGVKLVRARSGREAVRKLDDGEFSLVLLDVQMPELDGFSTAELIRAKEKTRDIPIIFVTAHGVSPELTRRAYSTGAADFLAKPIEPDILKAKVATFIDLAHRFEQAKVQAAALHQQQLREERQRWEAEALRVQVSEQRQATLNERAARLDAETANQIKDEFLATLSHELRTPLNTILGWVSILKNKDLALEGRERGLGIIERNARLQAKLIEDMLDISRIVAGKLRIDQKPVKLREVIERALDGVRPEVDLKDITLGTRLDDDIPAITGDADRLMQVMSNLVSNAVKFTPKGGKVEVSLRRSRENAEIIIADNGVGIPPEFLPHVFERFRQGDSATTRAHGGLGIGLSIVHHLVALHAGQIQADSAGVGRGSTFVITLPLVATPAVAAQEAAAVAVRPAGAPLTGVRILLADDEPEAREVLCELLELEGAVVRATQSAAAALKEVQEFRPAVLISDIGMPGEDGYSLISRVRTLSDGVSRIPAIALTAYASLDDAKKAREAGFQVHLAKPVDPDRLVATIASLAGKGATRPPNG